MSELTIEDMPVLRPIPGGGWVVDESWAILDQIIPAGTQTDLDSVPRIPYIYAAFKGRFRAAPLLHDYLYNSQAPRTYADKMFRKVMFMESTGGTLERQLVIEPIYYAVRLFGWLPYWLAGRK